LVVIFRHHADLLNIGCYLKHQAKSVMVINALSAVIMVALFCVLVPRHGLKGVVVSLIVLHVLRACAFYFTSQSLERVPYRLSQLTVAWGCTVLIVTLGIIDTEYLIEKRAFLLAGYIGYLCKLYFVDVSQISRRILLAWEKRYA
jgi:O-antigen/teichoic acid export membrane protein